jgi:hypothetical protein
VSLRCTSYETALTRWCTRKVRITCEKKNLSPDQTGNSGNRSRLKRISLIKNFQSENIRFSILITKVGSNVSVSYLTQCKQAVSIGLLDPWRWDRHVPKRQLTNHKVTPRNIPKERTSHLQSGGNLISRTHWIYLNTACHESLRISHSLPMRFPQSDCCPYFSHLPSCYTAYVLTISHFLISNSVHENKALRISRSGIVKLQRNEDSYLTWIHCL